MEDRKIRLVIVKGVEGGTRTIHNPDFVGYPDASQPFWTIIKDKEEIRTTGEVWIERELAGDEVFCEDSVVCTGQRCFHRLPHPKSEDCDKACVETESKKSCRPYRIG